MARLVTEHTTLAMLATQQLDFLTTKALFKLDKVAPLNILILLRIIIMILIMITLILTKLIILLIPRLPIIISNCRLLCVLQPCQT